MTGSDTVASYLIDRLKEVGVEHVFGVPGDYDFPLLDDIGTEPKIKWVGVCNELNAADAADGYARVRGMSAITGSCGVLEWALKAPGQDESCLSKTFRSAFPSARPRSFR